MSTLRERVVRALERPLAIAWKDLLVLGKGASAWKGATGAAFVLAPLVVLAAIDAYVPGPWRYAGRAILLATAGLFSALAFLVAVPAATSLALERDRDTIQGLVVSPARPRDLILGKLLAALANALSVKALALPALAIAYVLGGFEASFVPRYVCVLLAADLSFASFALYASARPLRTPRLGATATMKIGVSQAQLALQRSVGAVVLVSLVPIYSAIFLLPLAIQQGVRLRHALDAGAAAGALHPVFTLVAWGDAQVFSVPVPVWFLAAAFHVLLALPFIAGAAEAQRPAGAPRGRAPRAAFLVLYAFVLAVATGATWEHGPLVRGLVGSTLAAVLLAFGASGASEAPPPRRPFGRRDVLFSFVDPRAALVSSAETAPGYAFLLALVASVFILVSSPQLGPAVRACAGLGLAAVGLASLGARLAARAQRKDALAFEKARARGQAAGERTEGAERSEESAEEPATGYGTLVGLGTMLLVVGPLLSVFGLQLAQKLGQLQPLVPLLRGLGVLTLAANPLAALEPLVGGPGSVVAQTCATVLGVESSVLGQLQLVLWALVTVTSLATIRRAPEVKLESSP